VRWPRERSYGVFLGDLDRRRTDSQGIISYALALTRHVAAAIDRDERLVVFASAATRAGLGALPSDGRVEVASVPTPSSAAARMLEEQVRAPSCVRRAGIGVVHFPRGRIPFARLGRTRAVATVHDDIPMQYRAGAFGPRRRDPKTAYVVASLRHTLSAADLVITDTAAARRQLEGHTRTRAPVRVVVPGLGAGHAPGAGAPPRAPRLVVFDSALAHKRADEAVEFAARALAERVPGGHVCVIGRPAAAPRAQPTASPVVRVAGPLADDELARLVRESLGVVVASRYEGLGLPALEAWALGTPAVVAACDAAREVLWGVPGLYVPGDYESFATALDAVLALGPEALEDWSKVVRDRCDWERAAETVLAAYRELAS
jgi:glycosyltransferase involved in cell wall biosynthesis